MINRRRLLAQVPKCRAIATAQRRTKKMAEAEMNQDNFTQHHGHVRKDEYNRIRYDQDWQKRIFNREKRIFKEWFNLTQVQFVDWKKHVFRRNDPGLREQIPEKYGDYVYFVREGQWPAEEGGRNIRQQALGRTTYPIYCRHPASELGKKVSRQQQEKTVEVVLDMKDIFWIPKSKRNSAAIDKVKMNHDHSLVAFTVDIMNNERCTAGVKNMSTGKLLDFKAQNISSIEFFGGKPGHDFVYTVEMNESNRPYKVVRTSLKTGKSFPVFVDDDPTHYVDLTVSKDKKFLFINSGTKEDCEVWCIRSFPEDSADEMENNIDKFTPKLMLKRQKDIRVHIEHIRDFFLIISNNDPSSKNFKLQTLADEHFDLDYDKRNAKWEDLLAPGTDESFVISEFDCFEKFIAVYSSQYNKPKIIIQDLETKQFRTLSVNDGDVGRIEPMLNQEYSQTHLRFNFESPFIYSQMYEYDHNTGATRKLQEVKLQGSPQIVRNQFVCKEFLVPGHDGEEIPMNLYYKKGENVLLNRHNRVLLEGYGAYGINLFQGFNIVKTSAMEKGWVIAEAFVRGGGEKGISWHDQAKHLNKPNSVLDFISCAEYLIANRITHPNLLAAKGQSAGGTIVAQAVLNMRPELFRACVLNVPFLDVVNSLLDPSLPLSETDYLELGNPIEDATTYNLMNSYCPYQNLANKEFPSTFITSSVVDNRVPVWGTLKFIEKMRDLAMDPMRFPDFGNKNIVCRLIDQEDSGHFGSVSNDVNLSTSCFEFAWLDYLMFSKAK